MEEHVLSTWKVKLHHPYTPHFKLGTYVAARCIPVGKYRRLFAKAPINMY